MGAQRPGSGFSDTGGCSGNDSYPARVGALPHGELPDGCWSWAICPGEPPSVGSVTPSDILGPTAGHPRSADQWQAIIACEPVF